MVAKYSIWFLIKAFELFAGRAVANQVNFASQHSVYRAVGPVAAASLRMVVVPSLSPVAAASLRMVAVTSLSLVAVAGFKLANAVNFLATRLSTKTVVPRDWSVHACTKTLQ